MVKKVTEVTFACGHRAMVTLYGNRLSKRRLERLQKYSICPDCVQQYRRGPAVRVQLLDDNRVKLMVGGVYDRIPVIKRRAYKFDWDTDTWQKTIELSQFREEYAALQASGIVAHWDSTGVIDELLGRLGAGSTGGVSSGVTTGF